MLKYRKNKGGFKNENQTPNFTALYCIVFVLLMVMPFAVAYAASTMYSFTMELRMVNGKDSGMYHTLDAGTAYISGTVSIVNYPSATPGQTTNYTLYQDVFLFDKIYTTVYGSRKGSFSGSFGQVPAGDNFYLRIWTTEVDIYTRTGYGHVYNR